MKKRMRGWLLAALMMGSFGCAAEDLSYEGTIVAGETIPIRAEFGGKVSECKKRAGELVQAGETVASIETKPVYAPMDGTVSGLYIEAGDRTEDVTERYGASLYLEPTNRYVITATVEKAFTASENRYIHLGESVYLKCAQDGSHTGKGRVATLTEKGYTVEVTEGEFFMREKVDIFRQEDFSRESCVGRGTLDRSKPVAIKGEGSVLRLHVKNGDRVKRGQLLFETVDGTLDGMKATDHRVFSSVSGIVASVEKGNGETVARGDALMKVIPTESLQVAFEVPESDLFVLKEGQAVSMELYWENESGKTYSGEITFISHLSSEQKDETAKKTYLAYASMDVDERIRAGMTVIVNVVGDGTKTDQTAEEAAGPEAAEGAKDTAPAGGE